MVNSQINKYYVTKRHKHIYDCRQTINRLNNNEEVRTSVAETKADEGISVRNESILFVDDEERLAQLEYQMLKRLGYKAEVTTSPVEALDLFRSKPDQFDLVITDLTMPQMIGDKLAKEILNI